MKRDWQIGLGFVLAGVVIGFLIVKIIWLIVK